MRQTTRTLGCWLTTTALTAVVAGLLVAPLGAADAPAYHSYAELTAALKAAAAAHPDLATVVSIGKTSGGRDIWALEIAQPKGVPVQERPGLLVAGTFEGDHLVGSELALAIAQNLLGTYASDPTVKARLDSSVIYIIPRVNPDGAELMFAPVKTGSRLNASSFDADNDLRANEDGPDDLNKDGLITVMRVKDPKGPFMVSPDDARLMKKADAAKGERGGWTLYTEGLDNDGDGFINEDGPGGVDINRNFMHQYPYFAPDAGRYMVSELETRAVLDYVLKHRNIAAILTFGESDNLINAQARVTSLNLVDWAEQSTAEARKVGFVPDAGPMGRGMGMMMTGVMDQFSGNAPNARGGASSSPYRMQNRNPETTVNTRDAEYLRPVAEKYRDLTGLRQTGYTRAPAGAFYEYGYFQYGVPSFSTPGWGLPGAPSAGTPPAGGRPAGPGAVPPAGAAAAGGPGGPGRRPGGAAPASAPAADVAGESIDQKLLQWMDAEKIDGFVTWTPFKHPTLGDVEIGGFKPYVTVNPPAAKLPELAASHTAFVLHLTSLYAKVQITKLEATALATGVYRVTADVENAGYLPTATAQAVTARAVTPTLVQLGVAPETIVAGSAKSVFVPVLAGSGGRQSFEWIVNAKAGATITLKVLSQKAGTASASVTLK